MILAAKIDASSHEQPEKGLGFAAPSGSEALTAFCSSSTDQCPAGTGFHAGPESMGAASFCITWLESTFAHCSSSVCLPFPPERSWGGVYTFCLAGRSGFLGYISWLQPDSVRADEVVPGRDARFLS